MATPRLRSHGLAGLALLVAGQPLLEVVGGYAVAWAAWNLLPRGRSDGALLWHFLRTRDWHGVAVRDIERVRK